MKKPTNRKDRMQFIIQKLGREYARSLYMMTDSEVKKFIDLRYSLLENKPDYDEHKYDDLQHECIRCKCFVNTEFHTHCGCGEDRAVYSAEDWKRDIEDWSDRCDEDYEFISNGYKIINED